MCEDILLKSLLDEVDVINAEIMSDDFKKEVLKLEMKRVEELVPFINQGMEEAFKEEKAIVIVKDPEKTVRDSTITYTNDSSFTLRTESGKIIGEMIYDEDELDELRNDPNVYFMSDNFVTYNNLANPGEKQFFVMTSETAKFFTDSDLEGYAEDLTVAIPSTNTDHYIKDHFNLPHDTHLGTLIIGYTPKKD